MKMIYVILVLMVGNEPKNLEHWKATNEKQLAEFFDQCEKKKKELSSSVGQGLTFKRGADVRCEVRTHLLDHSK